MNSRAMTLSVVMAGIAVFFVMSSVSSIEKQAQDKFGDEITVVVAKSNIKEMDTIVDGMLELKTVPKKFVEPAAVWFSTSAKAETEEYQKAYSMETKRIIGNVAIVPIHEGEQISLNKISEPSMRTGLAPQVTPGKRAMAISVDEMSSVAKLVKPGDRVDVIAVMDFGGGAGGRENRVAKTVFQDVAILAVGRNISNNLARRVETDPSSGRSRVKSLTDFDGYASVTLELDPSQAQMLAAIVVGAGNKLILTLRNNDDTDRTALGNVRAVDALSDGVRVPAQNSPAGGTK